MGTEYECVVIKGIELVDEDLYDYEEVDIKSCEHYDSQNGNEFCSDCGTKIYSRKSNRVARDYLSEMGFDDIDDLPLDIGTPCGCDYHYVGVRLAQWNSQDGGGDGEIDLEPELPELLIALANAFKKEIKVFFTDNTSC